jgi:hypothetical protein
MTESNSDAAERLAAVRAARKKLHAEVAAEREARAVVEELAREERALRDDQAIIEAEKRFGRQGEHIYVITQVDAPESDIVIVKRPNPVAFKRFQDQEESQVKHIEELCMPCVVYPSVGVVDRLVTSEKPALLMRIMHGVSYLAGARKAVEQGKV